MKKTLLLIVGLTLMLVGLAGALHAQNKDRDITGNRRGTLQASRGLRTLIKISKNDDKLKAAMYSDRE